MYHELRKRGTRRRRCGGRQVSLRAGRLSRDLIANVRPQSHDWPADSPPARADRHRPIGGECFRDETEGEIRRKQWHATIVNLE